MVRSTACLLVFLTLCHAQIQRPGIGRAAPPPAKPEPALPPLTVPDQDRPKKASIEGQVTNPVGDAVQSATVRLILRGGPIAVARENALTTQSDPKGKFVFEQLEPGRYTLVAERSRFVGTEATVTLVAGQRQTSVLLKVIPEGRISGRVVDRDRNPIPKPQITLLSKIYSSGRAQLFRGPGEIETAPDGTFTVTGLPVGRYYLFVASPELGQPSENEESYVNTYYPDVTDASAAVGVIVTAGSEVRDIEVRMRKEHVVHIRGKVADISGTAPSDDNHALYLFPKDSSAGASLTLRMTPMRNGKFDFDRVSPGAYTVMARAGSLIAIESVIVGKSNLDDMLLRLEPGAEIAGKVKFDAEQQSSALPYPGQINLYDVDRVGIGTASSIAKDGTFVLRNVPPGTYRVELNGIPAGVYAKSIRLGGQDLSASPLVLGSGVSGTMDVVVSPNAARASGVMRTSEGAPIEGVTVSAWSDHFFASAITNYEGAFDFPRLPPGEYRLLAWERIDEGLDSVPEFRTKFDGRALKIKLDEKAQASLVVPLIPRDAIDRAR